MRLTPEQVQARLAELDTSDCNKMVTAATEYCRRKRAFLLVDVPPEVASLTLMDQWMAANDGLRDTNAAVYFPRLQIADPTAKSRNQA